jgi:hypothetical protein
MDRARRLAMLRVAFLGALASSFSDRVRTHVTVPCDFIHIDESGGADALSGVDVLVTIAFTREMAAAASRLRLIQVPGATERAHDAARLGLDRRDDGSPSRRVARGEPPESAVAAVS